MIEAASNQVTCQKGADRMTATDFRPPSPAEGPIKVEIEPDLMDLVPMFLENRSKEVGQLRTALAEGDVTTVEDIGHRMKGLGGYGFAYVGEAGAALEKMARSGDLSGADRWIDAIEDYLSRVEPRVGDSEE